MSQRRNKRKGTGKQSNVNYRQLEFMWNEPRDVTADIEEAEKLYPDLDRTLAGIHALIVRVGERLRAEQEQVQRL